MIRVVVAEDHQLVRQGIVALLDRAEDIEVAGEASDGDSAIQLVNEMSPDVLVMDISMPNRGGIEALEALQAAASTTAVVILTMYADEAIVRRALAGGARGYVVKGSIADDLIMAIRIAHQGGTFVAPGSEGLPSSVEPMPGAPKVLSPRERQVLDLIGEGLTNQAVASVLEISVKTVERHRTAIMRKLGARNVVELIRSGVRLGYLDLRD